MGKPTILLQVKEDTPTLKRHLTKCKTLKQEKKVRELLYFNTPEPLVPEAQLCKELNISRRTLQRWKRQYSEEGIVPFLKPQSRKQDSGQINAQLHKAFEVKLNDIKDPLLGYWHAVRWAKTEHGAEVSYPNLRKYLIKHFGTKVKRGRRSHIEKHQGAEEEFLKSFLTISNRYTVYS